MRARSWVSLIMAALLGVGGLPATSEPATSARRRLHRLPRPPTGHPQCVQLMRQHTPACATGPNGDPVPNRPPRHLLHRREQRILRVASVLGPVRRRLSLTAAVAGGWLLVAAVGHSPARRRRWRTSRRPSRQPTPLGVRMGTGSRPGARIGPDRPEAAGVPWALARRRPCAARLPCRRSRVRVPSAAPRFLRQVGRRRSAIASSRSPGTRAVRTDGRPWPQRRARPGRDCAPRA